MLLIEEPFLGETLHTKDMQETRHEPDEETLSLCDLPLYGDHNVEEYPEEDLSTESQGSSSMSSSEQDYFEFFSQELRPSISSFPPENIIFCGKLIPYKQVDSCEKEVEDNKKKQTNIKEKNCSGIFGWKFSSIISSKRQVQSRNGKNSRTLMHNKNRDVSSSLNRSSAKTHDCNKQSKGYDFPIHKISMLTSSSSGKTRWHVFLFGISRFSTQVELRDIKSRLSRRHCPPPPPPTPTPTLPSPMLRRNSGLGPWGLIRVLSCGGNYHPDAMVAESMT